MVVDKEILDRDGLRAGKVDDLLLILPDGGGDVSPEVVAIVTGPTALSRNFSRPVRALVRGGYRLLGLRAPRPSLIAWEHVHRIGVVIEVDVDRAEAGWSALGDAVNRRFIQRLPGA
jgi:sporulation protein YlmC with PRC-barrel domain